MATQTSNLGLTKPAYSETADIADINNNMDKVDAAVHGVQNGMAILANGNVHSAVTSGQYVYVRNHGTLAEGLYTATTNISTNATLSTSNLTAVPNNGALNTLRDDVTSLNSKISNHYGSVIYGESVYINFMRSGNVVFMACVAGLWDSDANNLIVLHGYSAGAVVPTGYRPAFNTEVKEALNGKRITVVANGNITINEAISSVALRFSGCWITTDAMPS